MAEKEENYRDISFANTFVMQGESDFVVYQEKGVTRYQLDRQGEIDYYHYEIIQLSRDELFRGVISDCEVYLRLFDQGKLKLENVES